MHLIAAMRSSVLPLQGPASAEASAPVSPSSPCSRCPSAWLPWLPRQQLQTCAGHRHRAGRSELPPQNELQRALHGVTILGAISLRNNAVGGARRCD